MKWISINKSIPKIGQNVLVFHPWGKDMEYKDIIVGRIHSIQMYEESTRIDWVDLDFSAIEPTHWMPLPEPPKQDEQ